MKNSRHIPLIIGATFLMSFFLIAHVFCVILSVVASIAVITTGAYNNLIKILDVHTLKAFQRVTDYVDSVLMGK